MRSIAIAGSLGSGKSTVLKIVHSLGFPAVDCDAIVALLYKRKAVQKKLSRLFGTADKNKIAETAFSFPKKRKKLENLLHPLVWKELKTRLSFFRKQGKTLSFVEVPLLFEAKWQNRFGAIIFVKASKQKCLQRLAKKGVAQSAVFPKAFSRRKKALSKKQAMLRWHAQFLPKKKVKSSHYIINNNGSMAETRKQIKILLAALA